MRKQILVLGALTLVYGVLVFLTYTLVPVDQLTGGTGQTMPEMTLPAWQVGLIAGAGVAVVYGLLGAAGVWFARKLDLPGIFREGAGWRAWLWTPAWVGALCGAALVAIDQALAWTQGGAGFTHPSFPLSILASGSAGIGEEILFRGFVMGLWAFLANLALRRAGRRELALWIGVVIAALAFGAAHLPAAMVLFNVADPSQLPAVALVEIFLLNGFLGVVAGRQSLRNGLAAAIGIHFWADIVWHVAWPLLAMGLGLV